MNKFMETQKKIEKGVVSRYKKIEESVMSDYKQVEDSVVTGYKKIEDKFVEMFLLDKSSSSEGSKDE